jgi:SAM-dependent methyltransferase
VTDPEALARYYDLDLRDDPGDVDLYLALAARTGGPVLELAAGSGRIAVPLAAAGYGVTGVDNDPAMLARAELAWKRVSDESSDRPDHRGRQARRAGEERLPTGSGGEASAAGNQSFATRAERSDATVAAPAAEPSAGARASATTAAGSARRGRRHSPGTLDLVEADLTTVRLRERFGLAILALNTLLLLERPERQLAALRSLAAHRRPDGLAVVDVWLPGPEDLAIYDGRLLLEWIRDDPDTGDRVTKLASARFDSATATVVLTQLFDASSPDGGSIRRTVRSDRLRLVGAHELVRMADDAGLAVEELAGDHRMGAFGPGDERVILVGRLV